MSVHDFENIRWRTSDQAPVFRHRAVSNLIKRGPVLDVGCGDGLMLEMLAMRGIPGEGVDISEEAVLKCRKRNVAARQWEFTAAPLPYANNTFRTAILMDVLEHVYAPESLLTEVLRVASECVISVPNFNSLPARLQVLRGMVPENNTPGKGHVFWFNYGNLCALVQNRHYRIAAERVNTIWENAPLIGRGMRYLARRWPGIFALSFVIKICPL